MGCRTPHSNVFALKINYLAAVPLAKPCIFFGPDQNSCQHLTLAPHYFSVVLVTSNRKNHRQVTNKLSGIMRCASPFLPRPFPPSSHLCSLRQRFPAAHTRTPCRSR